MQVIGRSTQRCVNGQKQFFLEHAFNDILRRAHHIKIFVPLFYFGKHDLIDIECLIHNAYILTRLLLVVSLKLFEYLFVNIVGPIVYLQNILARLA